MTDAETIAKGLTKAQRELLVDMTIIMTQDAAKRAAFVDGFNERRVQRYAGTVMQHNYRLGQQVGLAVRAILAQETDR